MSSEIERERRRRLERLRERFTAVNTRSRTIRLNRCTRSGAFDLSRLPRVGMQEPLDELLGVLGRSADAKVTIIDHKVRSGDADRQAIADDLQVLAGRAHSDWLETGLRDLAVGWPLLEGRTPDGTWIRSPVLLYPLWLETTTSGRVQWVAELQGPCELNASLAQTLLRLSGVALTLDELLADDDDRVLAVDDPTWRGIASCLSRLGLAVPDAPLPRLSALSPRDEKARDTLPKGSFILQHHAVLGRFPPSGSAIVGDYDELLERTPTDAVLGRAAALLGADERGNDADPRPPTETEPDDAPLTGARGHAALASDSSQDEVLRWLDTDAPGLVVQGPPGTGKSQLIANLLTAAMAKGLRTLLVCEKRAALDVVAERLAHAGLGEPLALVHDVSADRNAVCHAIASTIAAVTDAVGARGSTSDKTARSDRNTARPRALSRLELTQEAYVALTSEPGGRPPLARLYEQAIDDDGRPLPDLASVAEDVTPASAEAHIPRVEALAQETERLAAPHPLATRADWSALDDQGRDKLRADLLVLHQTLAELASLEAGVLDAREAASLEREIWVPADSLLELFAAADGRELARFLLFWVWTGGHAAHGEWSQVMQRLESALKQLHPVPYELIVESRATLEEWIGQLQQLARIARGPGWARVFRPSFWKLRTLPGDILDRCPSLFRARAEMAATERAAPVNVERLCTEAIRWQEFIATMPSDNPFLDFGFQGSVEEIAQAIEELRVQHDRVRALHQLREQLGERGEAYAQMPRFDSVDTAAEEAFIAAALADRGRARCFNALHDQLEVLRRRCTPCRSPAYSGDLTDPLEKIVALAIDGEPSEALARLDEILRAWDDVAEAVRIDAMLASEPPWVRRFLRGWRRHESGDPPGHDARRALRRAWRDLSLDGRTRTVLEAPLVDDELLRLLADDVEQARDQTAVDVIGAYRDRIAQRASTRAAGKTLRQLAAQARKRRRRLTLRQLVEQFWGDGLADVRPVWLCSPDSVASMFPLQRDLFDLLVIDEASQCPVESAVPVALRAKRLLVAGDEQQMPPSRFFRASHGVDDRDDDGTVLGSQSVLELARVAYPSTTLRWHYRSRHESLVSYSNRAFYGGQLITAPRAERELAPDVEGLHFVQVEGLWQEQQNAIEAERVVDLVGRLLRRTVPGGNTPPSIGVVTFNLNQTELILQRLGARSSTDPELRKALARDRRRPPIEQLFVRNLENVQGDERDVIVFSPGYGPTERGGPVHARFGPVGQVGGEKRLNVAVTRARLGVWVVCSFDPEVLDVSGTRRVGPKLLRGYLRYVKASSSERDDEVAALLDEAGRLGSTVGVVPPADLDAAPRDLGTRVRDAFATALRERGLQVSVDHGLGAQRIDLAVRADADADWAVGVDCLRFLAIDEPITRDVYARGFWQRLGWRVQRVTPGMWVEERAEVIDRLEASARGD